MKNRPALVTVLTACTLAALGLTACSPSGATASADPESLSGSITMRVYPFVDTDRDKEFWAELVTEFQKEAPDVDVSVDVQPWTNMDVQLTTAITGGTAPDAALFIPDNLARFQSQGALAPLGDFDTTGYSDSILSSVTFDGQIYAAPVNTSIQTTVCDKVAMDAVGMTTAPATWDEVYEWGEKAKEKGYYVTSILATNDAPLNSTFYPFVFMAGGAPFDADGELTVDSDAMIGAAQFFRTLVENGYVPENELTVQLPAEQSAAHDHKVLCDFAGVPSLLKTYQGWEDLEVFPPLMDEVSANYGTVHSFAMLEQSKNKPATEAWLSFLASDEVMKQINEFSSYFPAKSTVSLDLDPESAEAQMVPFADLMTTGKIMPYSSEVARVVAPEVQAAAIGAKTPEQAMADAAAAAAKIVEQSR